MKYPHEEHDCKLEVKELPQFDSRVEFEKYQLDYIKRELNVSDDGIRQAFRTYDNGRYKSAIMQNE